MRCLNDTDHIVLRTVSHRWILAGCAGNSIHVSVTADRARQHMMSVLCAVLCFVCLLGAANAQPPLANIAW